ncbi:MAG: low affinity iron permease family protein [Alphaproteobacteria bacterium]
MMAKKRKGFFTVFSKKTANYTGHPATFALALGVIIVWGVSGPLFGFSDTWQLVINTGTTIITFLMVFLIQNTQNRDTMALQLKLDELIRATKGAHTILLDLEELSEDELHKIRDKYEKIAAEGRKLMKAGKSDMEVPEVVLDQDLDVKKPKKKKAVRR